ncbi:hypothetical protein Pcinc_037730 [Petrolisthes cinctipes]|uniref:Uncharacterized protein n=1 Tax=Petrolisthes cinctipes TaxID=88211 RepID=A0AAE1BVE8_PETCI|nr:hypothetical protein Pcinc_037730 [Petrolisthes cinctipes]
MSEGRIMIAGTSQGVIMRAAEMSEGVIMSEHVWETLVPACLPACLHDWPDGGKVGGSGGAGREGGDRGGGGRGGGGREGGDRGGGGGGDRNGHPGGWGYDPLG